MVLVSSEWPTNKDDDQKTSPASLTPEPQTVAPTALSSGGKTVLGLPESTRSVNGGGAASTVKRKKAQHNANMEAEKKMAQDPLISILEMNALADSNNEMPIENQENNNLQVFDTNTLQGASNPDCRTADQQMLRISMNSVLNGNTSVVGGAVNNSISLFSRRALQGDKVTECGNLLVAPVAVTPVLDLDIGSDSANVPFTGEAKIVLHCEVKSHKFETRTILLQPNQDCKVGRLIAKSKASEGNAIFDCKVLSRNHAILWYTPDGRFWVKDTKSSNGTFINDIKLGNDPAELHYGDIVKFGVEVIENSRQEVHGCIIARVTIFLPDGREAISIEADQMMLAGPNRISFDEIQRLNSFLQEAAQREKTLKAKLSSLQGVLDSTQKNSAMSWQSMITEDQLLHKINLLEKKLHIMEKTIPENALRNEIVKLLEDKTTYQMTAKEALRKVYQERCEAMQMLTKMEMAYATSENECGLLRAQALTSKQTLQDFNARLERLQQEYMEYKEEAERQQQEASEQEERTLNLLKEKLSTQELELEELRLQVKRLHQTIAEHGSKQLEQNVLNQLGDDKYEKGDNTKDKESSPLHDHILMDNDQQTADLRKQREDEELKLSGVDFKNRVCKSSIIMLLKNSDFCKGEDGSEVLKAIFNDDDGDSDCGSKEENAIYQAQALNVTTDFNVGHKRKAAETVNEFIQNGPEYESDNGIYELFENSAARSSSTNILEIQKTVSRVEDDLYITPFFSTKHDMLQEDLYKKKTAHLNDEAYCMQGQIGLFKEQHEQEVEANSKANPEKHRKASGGAQRQLLEQDDDSQDNAKSDWNEDIAAINNWKVEQEEELIAYKERLECSERSNIQLRNEISELQQKQHQIPPRNQVLMHRVLPIGCIAIALVFYLISSRI